MKELVRKWLFNNLANIITTSRLIFSAWLIVLAIWSQSLFSMFALVILCGVTDFLDGFVARRYNIESKIGGFLDRMADKIFICPIIIILIYRFLPLVEICPTIFFLIKSLAGIMVFLEIFLISSGIYCFAKGFDLSSNRWGKMKMFFQTTVVSLWFLSLLIECYFEIKIFFISIYLIGILLIISIGLTVKSIEGYYQRWIDS
jgi:CDP-diacylglycerol---glycerol-3-phosphate 3-phosphatidyltransferase